MRIGASSKGSEPVPDLSGERPSGPRPEGKVETHESLLRRRTETPRSEILPVERRPPAQSGAAGTGGAPAGRRSRRGPLCGTAGRPRARADLGDPHAGISRLPQAHLSALAIYRRRFGRGHPEHSPDRPRRHLSGLRGRSGRLSHGRHLLPDLGADLGQRLLERLERGVGPPMR